LVKLGLSGEKKMLWNGYFKSIAKTSLLKNNLLNHLNTCLRIQHADDFGPGIVQFFPQGRAA
jgi:hypothetical protein